MTRSRSEHYVSESETSMLTAFREVNEGRDGVALIQAMNANRLATLALALATLEAVGPPWPEAAKAMEDQYAPYYCSQEWVDEEAVIQTGKHDGKPHRCTYTIGHEKDDPHYCHCGSEL